MIQIIFFIDIDEIKNHFYKYSLSTLHVSVMVTIGSPLVKMFSLDD